MNGIYQRLRVVEPSFFVWFLLALVLIMLVILPGAKIFTTALTDPRDGSFTFANFVAAYGRWRYVEAFLNTLLVGIGVVVLSAVMAIPLAWAISRTDMPAKWLVQMSVFGSFIMPPYVGAIAWILLAGPNSGVLNTLWMSITGQPSGLLNIFNYWGMVFIMSLNLYFYIFVMTYTSLNLVSSELEDAASILGSGAVRTAFKVTLPMALPSIVGGGIIIFLQAMALFGVPALIALPARYPVVTTQLWQFFGYPVQIETAAAYSIPLLLLTVLMMWLQRRILSRKGYVSLTGKGGERRIIRLGPFRWVVFAYAMVVVGLSFILPAIILIKASFSVAWARPLSIANFTFENYRGISFPGARDSLLNSIIYGVGSASLALGLAICIAYATQRRLLPFGGLLSFLCTVPIVIPGVILAIGFYAAYGPPPLALYGTGLILILAFATRFLPIAYANSSAAIRSINPEMEEAVRILGGGRLRAVRSVVAPLMKRPLIGAWILIFIPAAQELSSAIFLTGPQNRVVSVLMLDLSDGGRFEALAALGMTLVFLTIAVAAVGVCFAGRDFMFRRS